MSFWIHETLYKVELLWTNTSKIECVMIGVSKKYVCWKIYGLVLMKCLSNERTRWKEITSRERYLQSTGQGKEWLGLKFRCRVCPVDKQEKMFNPWCTNLQRILLFTFLLFHLLSLSFNNTSRDQSSLAPFLYWVFFLH